MSDTIGNIHDTDITKVKIQVKNLVKDLENGHLAGLESRHQELESSFPAIYKYITRGFLDSNFNKRAFEETLNKMLDYVAKIQANKISQNDASEEIGQTLADTYFPSDLK